MTAGRSPGRPGTTRPETGIETETDVLVVGGGLVGLAAAAFLAANGTRVVLVERRPSTSRHPKARLVTDRSMELYRALGIAEAVYAAGEPHAGFVVADDLAADHDNWVSPPREERNHDEQSIDGRDVRRPGSDVSPCDPWSCDQQRIEQILARRAVELGAVLRFGSVVDRLVQDAYGVCAHVRCPGRIPVGARAGSGLVRARYAVAADGAHSGSRTELGIGWHGEPVEPRAVSVVFHADLAPAVRGRPVQALFARTAQAFLFARGTPSERTWQLGTWLRPDWDPSTGLRHELAVLLRTATGIGDLTARIEDVQVWETGAYVADRWRAGRVLLAGDAAHVMPPYGGLGGNAGVADAHALAWRLSAACDGRDHHLDSYTAERRPLARLIVDQALLRSRTTPGGPPPAGHISLEELVLGFRYGDITHPTENPARPSGDPGTRAPHVALTGGRSTLDLLDPHGWTVIGGPAATPVPGATLRTVPPADVTSGHHERWRIAYGGRGTLVRPDGVIAIRCTPI